jgi:hypothetical protein
MLTLAPGEGLKELAIFVVLSVVLNSVNLVRSFAARGESFRARFLCGSPSLFHASGDAAALM